MNIERGVISQKAKRWAFVLLAIQVILMIVFTFVEYYSAQIEVGALFRSPIFWIIWTLLLGCVFVFIFFKDDKRDWRKFFIHSALALIVVGQGITTLTAESGLIEVEKDKFRNDIFTNEDATQKLSFEIMLIGYEIKYYNGTNTPCEYIAYISVRDKENGERYMELGTTTVLDINNYRISLSRVEESSNTVLLTATRDVWGVRTTFLGYILLFVSLILNAFRKDGWLSLFSNPLLKQVGIALLILLPYKAEAKEYTFDEQTADEFGRIHILYENRVTEIETYALDFTKKLYGSKSYNGYTANQVLAGWIFNCEHWQAERIINTSNGKMSYAEAKRLYDSPNVSMKLKEELSLKIKEIETLLRGEVLRIFPFKISQNLGDEGVVWLSLYDTDSRIEEERLNRMQIQYSLLFSQMKGSKGKENLWIEKFIYHQHSVLGENHNNADDWLEHFYNKYCSVTLWSIISLLLGIAAFFVVVFAKNAIKKKTLIDKILAYGNYVLLGVILFILALRSYISGHLPFTTGYETMLCIAVVSSAFTLILAKRFFMFYIAGFVLTGLALLLCATNIMSSRITQVTPVLDSYWLCLHVMLLLIAYSLFSFTVACSVTSIVLWYRNKNETELQRYILLNRILLYPAVTTFSMGLFSGAIWANQTWGTYWTWNFKETWTLITLLVYGFALHRDSIKKMQSPLFFQYYLVFCFLSLVVTYFGINIILDEMYSLT